MLTIAGHIQESEQAAVHVHSLSRVRCATVPINRLRDKLKVKDRKIKTKKEMYVNRWGGFI